MIYVYFKNNFIWIQVFAFVKKIYTTHFKRLPLIKITISLSLSLSRKQPCFPLSFTKQRRQKVPTLAAFGNQPPRWAIFSFVPSQTALRLHPVWLK